MWMIFGCIQKGMPFAHFFISFVEVAIIAERYKHTHLAKWNFSGFLFMPPSPMFMDVLSLVCMWDTDRQRGIVFISESVKLLMS